jgi:protein involved in polysaccharide export with SLBB domain
MNVGASNVSQQLAQKQQESDNLISQITQASIALSQAQRIGDLTQVQAQEAELADLRNQLKIVDVSVVQLKLANQAALSTPTGLSQATSGGPRSDLINSGETIELFVMQDESFNAMYQVRQGGYILIPRVGRVQVAGMTIPSAESSVAKAFSQTMIVNPTIIIERPEATKSDDENGGVIYLMGDFKRPGTFRISRGRVATILNTIIQSGGETQSADLSRVRLMRLVEGRNLVEEIDVNEILKGGRLANDLILRDGDILHIPSKPEDSDGNIETASARGMGQQEDPSQPSQARDNGVFVTGRVKSPGFLTLTERVGMTAYTAILAKGGFAPFSNTKKVYVVREVGGGQKVHIPVNIRNVQHGLEPDVELQSKDIVVVPEKFFSL